MPREEDAAQVAPSPRSLFVAQLRQDIIRAQDTKTITLLEARWLLYVLDTTM